MNEEIDDKTIVAHTPVKRNFYPGKIEDKHYVMGDVVQEPLMPDGHGWGEFLPIGETQNKNGLDPSSCPAGGTLNCIEAIGRFKFGTALNPKPGIKPFQNDLSERYLSIMMGMSGYGGDPHVAAETMRLGAGAIPESSLPFSSLITTLQQYFSPRPMTYALFKVGYHWTLTYDFKHWWVFHPGENITVAEKQRRIRETLKSSPVGVSGYAWSLHADGRYYHDGPDIHWFVRFEYNEDKIFDTYPPYVKTLDPNYDYGYAKGYSLNRRIGSENIPDEPQDCYLEYTKYLVKWVISKFLPQ